MCNVTMCNVYVGRGYMGRRQLFCIRLTFQEAVVAERLRRLTRNQIPSGSVGSNPTDCEILFCDRK